MNTPLIGTGYPTAAMVLIGLLISTFVIFAIVSFLYWLNTRMRRSMKTTGDDFRIEQDIEAGHTLHAEGIYGTRHRDEGGLHLQQENPHPLTAGLKTKLKTGAGVGGGAAQPPNLDTRQI